MGKILLDFKLAATPGQIQDYLAFRLVKKVFRDAEEKNPHQ